MYTSATKLKYNLNLRLKNTADANQEPNSELIVEVIFKARNLHGARTDMAHGRINHYDICAMAWAPPSGSPQRQGAPPSGGPAASC